MAKEKRGRASERRERKGEERGVCVCVCVCVCACAYVRVYADEICRPQQPPVKRNRISSPPGENLEECRWRIVAHRFLSWTLRGAAHIHAHTHTHTHTHTHYQQTKNSVFRSLLFSLQRAFLHFLSFIKTWLYVIEIERGTSSIPIHFVLLTKLFPTSDLSLVSFSNLNQVDFYLIRFILTKKNQGINYIIPPSTSKIQRIVLVTLLQEHIDRSSHRRIGQTTTMLNTVDGDSDRMRSHVRCKCSLQFRRYQSYLIKVYWQLGYSRRPLGSIDWFSRYWCNEMLNAPFRRFRIPHHNFPWQGSASIWHRALQNAWNSVSIWWPENTTQQLNCECVW